MNFLRIEHVNKSCQNLEATLRFYQTLFPDWSIRAQAQSSGFSWLHFGNNQFYMSLYERSNPSEPISLDTGNIDHIGFVIEDGKKMIELLEANGLEYVLDDAPETKYRIYVKDPDSTHLELVEYQESYALR
jgi:catechol 2,3-dioxygenase-like lactoylglutathione lyase family enzyme